MGGEGEVWRRVREQVRTKRATNLRVYTEQLTHSGHTYTVSNFGQTFSFREVGKPPVDFYPSTGRWRVVGLGNKTYNGGATAFLAWYRKQVADD